MPNCDLKNVDQIFNHILAGNRVEDYEKELSEIFEFVATRLLYNSPLRKGQYFDGVVGLVATVKTPRKAEFVGEMWVGANRDQWTEAFRATVTDKRTAKQGILIAIQVGADRADCEIMSLFNTPIESASGDASTGG
jgi:hypothetical protein